MGRWRRWSDDDFSAEVAQDVRYALRTLGASPAFLATTVLTLAVGLSLITVAFSIFNAYVLRPFAVADPARLFRVAWRAPSAAGTSFSWRDYDELRARTDLFDAVVAENVTNLATRPSGRRQSPALRGRSTPPAPRGTAGSARPQTPRSRAT
jgi:hypothetical protein